MKNLPLFLTPLITGTPFLHAYYKKNSQPFIEDFTNLISLYTTTTNSPATNLTYSPNIVHENIRICLPFRMLRTVFNKLEHFHTGIKSLIKRSINITTFRILKSGSPFSYMNVNARNTLTWKFKLLLHNLFQNMLRLSITEFLWIHKDLSTLLHTTNPTCML